MRSRALERRAARSGAQDPGGKPLIPRPTVAGIGASAGGLHALQALFDAIPAQSGIAYVVIMHLSPEYESSLVEILSNHTSMPVESVNGVTPLEVDHVYVIAPNRRQAVADGSIDALPFEQPRYARMPIDSFFVSLALEHGDSFAVILSGSGSDGAVGVHAVKEAGGLMLVQDPATLLRRLFCRMHMTRCDSLATCR